MKNEENQVVNFATSCTKLN